MDIENLHTDQELLQRMANDDRQAFHQLFDLHWGQVYGTALRLTKSPELAKDLAQDIFLKLWDHRARLPEVKNFGSYLYTITRNLIHDHIRTRIFRESNKEFLLDYFTYQDSSQQERMEQKELSQALHEAIDQLPPKLRQVFRLSRFEGLSHEEIGQRLRITPLSSKTYMVRALLALRKKMAGYPDKGLLIAAFCLHKFWS